MRKNIDLNSIIAPNSTKFTDHELLQIYSSSSSESISSESSVDSYHEEPDDDNLMTCKLNKMNDFEFKRYFQINKSTVHQLIEKFKADQNEKKEDSGLSYVTQIYLTLSYLTSRESYEDLAKKYGVEMTVFWSSIGSTIQWIVRQPFINWPTHQEQQVSMENFESKTGVPFVIGAIGFTHIQFKPGNEDEESYRMSRCKQNKYSFVLQGVVDHHNRFIDIHCGEPGGFDGFTVLRKSVLYRNLYANTQGIEPRGIIVGNETYPSSNRIVSPFRQAESILSEQKQRFDKTILKPVENIKTVFATLRSRFHRFYTCFDRALVCNKLQHLRFLIQSVVACCLLHNFCTEQNDYVEAVDMSKHGNGSDVRCYIIDQEGRRQEILEYMQNKGVI